MVHHPGLDGSRAGEHCAVSEAEGGEVRALQGGVAFAAAGTAETGAGSLD